MANVVITLEYNRGEKKDLALPMDVSCRVLAAALANALKLDSEMEEAFTLVESDLIGARSLPQNATLADAGILHGRVLALRSEKLKEARVIPQGGACLVTRDGRKVELNSAYVMIGRRDVKHNILPDLDLTDLDTNKVSSRRHACIEFDQRNWVISDLGSSNGTWVNGDRIQPKTPRRLNEGDEILFGRKGVSFKFLRESK